MSTNHREYGEGRPPIPAIDVPVLMFMINNSLPRDQWTDLDVYRATQGSWIIGEDSRQRAIYALGVSNGVVRGAYRIDGWRQAEGRRWSFDGHPAPELDVVGTSIKRMKSPQGASNPVRKFLEGIKPDQQRHPPDAPGGVTGSS